MDCIRSHECHGEATRFFHGQMFRDIVIGYCDSHSNRIVDSSPKSTALVELTPAEVAIFMTYEV